MRHTFPKTEHLTSQKVIDRLFHRDKLGTPPADKPTGEAPLTFYSFPFRVLYLRSNPTSAASPQAVEAGTLVHLPQVLFSVPKRTFKKAVDRNAVRRRVKEAYRLHKHRLLGQSGTVPIERAAVAQTGGPVTQPPIGPVAQPLAQIVFLYTAKTKISFEEIEKGMKLAIKKLL